MMQSAQPQRRYQGVFPVVPSIFDSQGRPDPEGQRRALDFMIDAGSDGLCILANFSEQFALSDAERDAQMRLTMEHVAGRVPVIVTTSHFSTDICVARSLEAQAAGAAMVMVLPPYHGATMRADPTGCFDFYAALSESLSIPIMVQDAPISGTVLSADLLARMARELENVSYFKIETAGAATKLRRLIDLGGEAVEGPWDGEEAITLLADLEAGATGAMTGGGYPDGIRTIIDGFQNGGMEAATEAYRRWLPLINHENRQTGFATAKILMRAGGIIESDLVRRPTRLPSPQLRESLLALARPLDPLVFRWAT